MATTEAGGGVPQELRERLRKFAVPAKCEDVDDHGLYTEQVLDYLFAEIAAAGFKMVPADAIVLAPCEPEVLMPGFDPDEYDLEGRE